MALGVPLGVHRGVARGVISGVPWGVGNGVRLGVPMGVLDQDMRGVMESSMGQLHNSTISSLSFCSASGEEKNESSKILEMTTYSQPTRLLRSCQLPLHL